MSKALPKISIITPSYNQAAYLEETILSVLNQNYPNLEYVIIDGGSNDGSVEIIKKYAQHLHYWVSEKDKGQSEAINKGLHKISGDIVTWLNSDDVFLANCLFTVAEHFMQQKELAVLHGRSVLFGKGKKEQIIGLETDIDLHRYLSTMKCPQPSCFFSTKVFNGNSPLNEQLHYAMDFDLISKIILEGHAIKAIPDLLSKYRIHAHSKSNSDFIFLKDWARVVYQTLNGFESGKKYASVMASLLFEHLPQTAAYSCKISFSEDQLQQIFLEHLHLQYHYHYRFHRFKKARDISAYLKRHYAAYHQKMQFKKYDRRAAIVPGFLYKWVRKA